MSRGNELLWNLGFNILLPRFCLFVLLPGLLVAATMPHWPPLAWAVRVMAVSFLVFGANVAANLGISRYLRLRETPESPYTYAYWYVSSRRSSYFRIQVSDKKAFRYLLRDLRRDHPCEAIGRWLRVDEAVYTPLILLFSLLPMLCTLVLWLVRHLVTLYKAAQDRPLTPNSGGTGE